VAKRLVSSLRDSDTVARLGGDEFTIILPGLKNKDRLASIASKLITILAQPFHIAGHRVCVTTSLGISTYPQDSQLIETLVECADEAMFEAKRQGKNCYRFHQSPIDESR
jgi:diguanylate cyclase (GGDEF)-like protein